MNIEPIYVILQFLINENRNKSVYLLSYNLQLYSFLYLNIYKHHRKIQYLSFNPFTIWLNLSLNNLSVSGFLLGIILGPVKIYIKDFNTLWI